MKSVIFILFLMISLSVLGQPGNPEAPPEVPIDGAIGLLIALGAVFGMKKVYDFNKKKK